MTIFLQGLAACFIASLFFACIMAPFRNSGRHAAAERAEQDRQEYFQQGDLARRRQTWRARG